MTEMTEAAEEIVTVTEEEEETETEETEAKDVERGTETEEETEVENQNAETKNMTRFFFNLGKRDNLKKMDMLEIINKATAKSKNDADIGDIEILEKNSHSSKLKNLLKTKF